MLGISQNSFIHFSGMFVGRPYRIAAYSPSMAADGTTATKHNNLIKDRKDAIQLRNRQKLQVNVRMVLVIGSDDTDMSHTGRGEKQSRINCTHLAGPSLNWCCDAVHNIDTPYGVWPA